MTELCNYRLNLYGKVVGTHTLRTQQGKRGVVLEARMALQGALGQKTITQTSQLNPALESLHFTEETQERSETRLFEVTFDRERGVVRLTQSKGNSKDTAEEPYMLPYRDPLGLLYALRERPERLRVPMLGKEVVAERFGGGAARDRFGRAAGRTLTCCSRVPATSMWTPPRRTSSCA